MTQKINFNNLRGDSLTIGNTVITGTGVQNNGESVAGVRATIYANNASLPLSGLTAGQYAFSTANSTLFYTNGSGWYKVTTINQTPTIDTFPAGNEVEIPEDSNTFIMTLTANEPEGTPITWGISLDSDANTLVDSVTNYSNGVFEFTKSANVGAVTSGVSTVTASDGVNIATKNISILIPSESFYFALGPSTISNLTTTTGLQSATVTGTDGTYNRTFEFYDDASNYTIPTDTINGQSGVHYLDFNGTSGLFIHPHPWPALCDHDTPWMLEFWKKNSGSNPNGSDGYGQSYTSVSGYDSAAGGTSPHITLFYTDSIYFGSPSGSYNHGIGTGAGWNHVMIVNLANGYVAIYSNGSFLQNGLVNNVDINATENQGGFQVGSFVGGNGGSSTVGYTGFGSFSSSCDRYGWTSITPSNDSSFTFTPEVFDG